MKIFSLIKLISIYIIMYIVKEVMGWQKQIEVEILEILKNGIEVDVRFATEQVLSFCIPTLMKIMKKLKYVNNVETSNL